MVVLVVSACGNVSERGGADAGPSSGVNSPATRVTSPGVYEVGVDLAPGVYTAGDLGCVGFTASTADFDMEDTEADPDDWVAASTRVGDMRRIVIHQGEFFTSLECGRWQRENRAKPESADPATLAGGCEILVGGDGLAQQALTFPKKPESAADKRLRHEIQDKLSSVVFENAHKNLANPAGQLVDFLDDPTAYVEAGKLSNSVTRAYARIQKACAGP